LERRRLDSRREWKDGMPTPAFNGILLEGGTMFAGYGTMCCGYDTVISLRYISTVLEI